MDAADHAFLPQPRRVVPRAGRLALSPGTTLALRGAELIPPHAREALASRLAQARVACAAPGGPPVVPVAGVASERAQVELELVVAPEVGRALATPAPGEAYALRVDPAGLRVVGGGPAGLYRGLQTLTRLLAAAEGDPLTLPALEVEDAPTLAVRGVTLDVSRDRVPTMETLLELVDLLADLRFNQLQLYTEHTFAYRRYPEVWAGADPLTAEEVRALDEHCAARFVELVPNQQSFGHMHRWLKHPRLAHLAECAEGVEHPFAREREPYGLCPVDPAAIAFLGELYDELLPNFRSRSVNVGCDETIDLGRGRSRAACAARGEGRVYLEFLSALNACLAERDRRMQFWADIVLGHPELVPELPARLPGATAMLWGYEADHPFEREAGALAASGLPFCVCPGTSSWQSVAGRFENLVGNVSSAAHQARAAGALGLVVTDWGDRGHLQPLPSSYAGWLLAGELAWNADAAPARRTPEGMAALLARHVLDDPSGAAGEALVGLACAGEATGVRVPNASPLSLLLTAFERPFPGAQLSALTHEGLERAEARIESSLERLAAQRMRHPRRRLLEDELRWCGGLLRFACALGRARIATGAVPLGALDAELRGRLRGELAPLAREHRRLWRARSRPGGLEDSASWLERIRAALT